MGSNLDELQQRQFGNILAVSKAEVLKDHCVLRGSQPLSSYFSKKIPAH
jgi:hypothetical protein